MAEKKTSLLQVSCWIVVQLFFLTTKGIILEFEANRKPFIYLSANVFLAWFVVILTCNDVHNRFFLVLSPYLYLLSLPMLQKIHTKISATNEQ
jgi:hypothetical protein